jgi:cAMP-dependent protein kinase regulator
MSGSSIFGNLSPEQWEAIIGAMYPAQRKAGEPVIVQEEPAQNYFVIDSGKCDVFMRRDLTGSDELVLTIGTGACFGEIALMYECHNNITIKAHQDVTVWTIDRKTFRSIVVHSTSRKRRQYELFLSKVDLFNTLTGTEKALLADALEDITYNDGDVLMQYGEEGDYFYICTKGTATVMSNQVRTLISPASSTMGNAV